MKFVVAPIKVKVLDDFIKTIDTKEGTKKQRMLSLFVKDSDKHELVEAKTYPTFMQGENLIDKEIVLNTLTISPYSFNGRSGVSFSIESMVTGLKDESKESNE